MLYCLFAFQGKAMGEYLMVGVHSDSKLIIEFVNHYWYLLN